MLLWLVILFCREKVGCPAGIFPRAFSDMPRSCKGTLSSTTEDMEGLRELWTDGDVWAGVFCPSCSSSESSSPPMAKGLFSSGIRPNGDRAPEAAWGSSSDADRTGLVAASLDPFSAFRLSFWRSISCCPLSSVNSRTASKRRRCFRIA